MSEMESIIPVTNEEAKQFIRDFTNKANAAFRKLKANTVVSYHIHDKDVALGRFTYNEVSNKVLCGRVVIGRRANGKVGIIAQYHVTRQKLHADLNIQPRTEVKKNERKWSTR